MEKFEKIKKIKLKRMEQNWRTLRFGGKIGEN